MQITTIEFKQSVATLEQCPVAKFPEIAFIGRSNVGKSSLINFLANRKELAKTSQTPGKTQTLNYYLVNNRWYLVDMPGYGYARTSRKNRFGWELLIKNYILKRETLYNLFLLVDSRHEPLATDLDFIQWLGENRIPFTIVFTKIDKISATQLNKNLVKYKNRLLQDWEELPPIFSTSVIANHGRQEILNYIDYILDATTNK